MFVHIVDLNLLDFFPLVLCPTRHVIRIVSSCRVVLVPSGVNVAPVSGRPFVRFMKRLRGEKKDAPLPARARPTD